MVKITEIICSGLTHQIIDKSRCLAGGESHFSGHFGSFFKGFLVSLTFYYIDILTFTLFLNMINDLVILF